MNNITMLVPPVIAASLKYFAGLLHIDCTGMFVAPVSDIGSTEIKYYISSGNVPPVFIKAVRDTDNFDLDAAKARLPAHIQALPNVVAMTKPRLKTALAQCLIHEGAKTVTYDGKTYTVPQSPNDWLDDLGLEPTQMPDTTGAKK